MRPTSRTCVPIQQLGQVPESDQHFLGRVEFGKIIGGNNYEVNKSTSQGRSNNGKFGFFQAFLPPSSLAWAAAFI